jgi:hypothetical protein
MLEERRPGSFHQVEAWLEMLFIANGSLSLGVKGLGGIVYARCSEPIDCHPRFTSLLDNSKNTVAHILPMSRPAILGCEKFELGADVNGFIDWYEHVLDRVCQIRKVRSSLIESTKEPELLEEQI